MTTIDITGLNASRPQGMGFLHYDPEPMTSVQAAMLLSGHDNPYFDYLKGRVMKISIKNPLEPHLYDRDNGTGAAALAIAALRTGNTDDITNLHETGKRAAALEIKAALNTTSHEEVEGGVAVFYLGLSDVAEPLNEAIDRSLESGNDGL